MHDITDLPMGGRRPGRDLTHSAVGVSPMFSSEQTVVETDLLGCGFPLRLDVESPCVR